MKSVLVTPIMRGLDEIAQCFGVGKDRVRDWINQGAPIYQDRVTKKHYAHVGELWEWRKKQLVKPR